MKSVEVMTRFRAAQFDVIKAGKAAISEVISVNPVYLKSGIASGDVSLKYWLLCVCLCCDGSFGVLIIRCLIVCLCRGLR